MRYLIPFLLIAGCLLLVCSDSSTDGDDPVELSDTTITVFYQTDDTRSVTTNVIASQGGTVTTTDADSIIYTLTVPAYSLPHSTAITLTPIDTLGVDEPAVFEGVGDSAFCIPGILCEPEGVMFDSGATLTIQFPESMDL